MCRSSECGCGHAGHHRPEMAAGHGGCCHGPGQVTRRFPAREEVLAELEGYLKQLQAEVKGVEERIADYRKAD